MPRPVDRGRRETSRARRPLEPNETGLTAGAPEHVPSVRDRLADLLDSPHLARVVPHLNAETLHQLIRYRGLDVSADLLQFATPEQVRSILDLDLWRSATPAGDERFDVERFGEWVEALVENGDAVAARIVAGLDQRLVTAGLAGYISVFDAAARVQASSDGDASPEEDARAGPGLVGEIGGYLIRARRTDAWDAIVALLVALDAGHPDYFHAVMRGCRRLSDSTPEIDGLDHLLMAPQQLLDDLGQARDLRRSQRGYLTPAQARAFRRMAEQLTPSDAARPSALHAFASDFLRPPDAPASVPGEQAGTAGSPSGATTAESIGAVAELLAEAGILPGRPRALLAGPPGRPSPAARMRALMEHVHAVDDRAFAARSRELAFLANVLAAGCCLQARPFTAGEASDAVVATCNLGLEVGQPGIEVPDAFLADHDLVTVFHVGWRALHELRMFVADRLAAILDDLRCADLETQMGLHVLRRALARQRETGSPSLARDALDVIATLDVAAWAGLVGVLDECPVVPAALTATLERRTGRVSATAFEFISTAGHLDEVHAFMARLLDILVR